MRYNDVMQSCSQHILKSSFVVTVIIGTGSHIFLVLELFEVPSEEKV